MAQDTGVNKESEADTTDTSGIVTDTLKKTSSTATGLNAEVKYSAEDSIRIDRNSNIVYLYGQGRVSYEGLELDADYISLDQKNNTIFAKGRFDPKTNRYHGRPIFKQGSEPPVTTDSLVFNFKTKKGKTFGTFSEVEGGFIQAKQSKKNPYNEVSLKDAIYSTCNLPHPHFGIHITKGIVTEKNIVTGPAYLVIEGIPFPVGVPFGFFPKANKRASGIMFPTFGEEAARGFFMRNLGYYIGLNDYWDATVQGSLYSKGSYEANLLARYRKNYKYDGSLNFRFASTKLASAIEGTASNKANKDFNLQWSHSQRQEANPGTTFSASVNVGTGAYFSNTGANGTYNMDQITRNSMSSSISYGKTFADGRVNFTSSLSHRQDISAGTIELNLPQFNLAVSTFNPFDSKNRTGEQKWYQKISVGYNLLGDNSISTKESELFKKSSLKDFDTRIQHSIPVSLSLNALKYFQVSLSVPYNEDWYFKTIRQTYNSRTQETEITDTIQGFARLYRYSYSSSISTKLYGIKNFKRGKLAAIRHVITPSIGFSYTPDFGGSSFPFTKELRNETGVLVRDNYGNIRRYSIFQDGGISSGRSGSLTYSLDNNIEGKKRPTNNSNSDTTANQSGNSDKIDILQGLSFSGSYNFLADSFKFSPISFSGRTSFFKKKLGLTFSGILNPYQTNSQGVEIDRLTIPRLTNFNVSTDFSLNSSAISSRDKNIESQQNKQNITEQQREQLDMINRDPNAFVDFNVPWNISASLNFNYSKRVESEFNTTTNTRTARNVTDITSTVSLRGDLSVTPKWKVQYNTNYDIQRNEFSFTNFSIYRDLHCWDLSINWVPFGRYKSYSVDLRVRANILQDLKLSKRRDYYNNF
ncbi:putative LPS assembly protein LptD [Rubrolithibacter danxiaensis]|uniref:putative LPS assembly protein LptD n=1 Tax=Rubrolithibacter danxiaensis TaxID=3390805 RepID=UPI003BF854FF